MLATDVDPWLWGRGESVFITGSIVVQPFLIREIKVNLSIVLGNQKS